MSNVPSLENLLQKHQRLRVRRIVIRALIILFSPVLLLAASLFAILCLLTEPFGLSAILFYWEKYWNYSQSS